MTNTRMFLTMLFGALCRRRSRAVMAVIAVTVGAATLFALASICIAVPQQMNERMRAYGANLIVTPNENGPQADGITSGMVAHTTEMVTAKAPARHATYRYETVRINAAPYVLAGIDVRQVRDLNHHWSVEGAWPSAGNVMVGRDVADALGVTIGSRITVGYRADDDGTSRPTENGRVSSDIMDDSGTEYRISGIVDTGGSEDDIVYARLADVDKLTGTKRGADVIEYSVNAVGDDLHAIVSSINAMTSMGVTAKQVTKITSADTRIITMLQTLFWIVSLTVLALTLVGVGTTIGSIVSQRNQEIGLRKALGASSRAIGMEFYVESAIYGLIGGLIGAAVGYALARMLCQVVFQHVIDFNWALGLASVTLSVLLAVAASVPPVGRATRIDPAVVLREE